MDIVEKLRARQTIDDAVNQELSLDYPNTIHGEAADEIERLRSELERVSSNAARYNWLKLNGKSNSKNSGKATWPRTGARAEFSFNYWVEDLDQSINNAMANDLIDQLTKY